MKRVKLGIIGCGIAANDLHLPALRRLSDRFEIACVCNHTEGKARSFAEKVGAPYVLDPAELVRRRDVEAVDIVLPVELNLETTRMALEAGKHVLVEKPIAVNAAEAARMLALAAAHPGLVTMVAENYRYKESLRHIKRLLDAGSIGSPYMVQWNGLQKLRTDNKYAQTRWRIRHKYEGGFVTDAGIHNIAALRDLFGDLSCRGAASRSVNPAIGRLDSLQYLFDSRSGVAGIFMICFSAESVTDFRLTILGSEGSIVFDNDRVSLRRAGEEESSRDFPDDLGYAEEFEDFHRAIQTLSPPISTFEEAAADLSTMLAALEAAKLAFRS